MLIAPLGSRTNTFPEWSTSPSSVSFSGHAGHGSRAMFFASNVFWGIEPIDVVAGFIFDLSFLWRSTPQRTGFQRLSRKDEL
jgi:hypothetical protein